MRAHFQFRDMIYRVQACGRGALEYRQTAYGRVGEDTGGRHGRLPGGSGAKLSISRLLEDFCGSLSSGGEERRMRTDKVEFNAGQQNF